MTTQLSQDFYNRGMNKYDDKNAKYQTPKEKVVHQ